MNLVEEAMKKVICREANCSLNVDHDDDGDDDDKVLAFLYRQSKRNLSLQ
jgi:hypothetical protein